MTPPDLRQRVLVRTAIVFAVLSFVPVWTTWYVGPRELTTELSSFWSMLLSVPRAFDCLRVARFFDLYWPELVKTAVVLVVSFFVARRLARRAEAA
jgi:hypothetical protein